MKRGGAERKTHEASVADLESCEEDPLDGEQERKDGRVKQESQENKIKGDSCLETSQSQFIQGILAGFIQALDSNE